MVFISLKSHFEFHYIIHSTHFAIVIGYHFLFEDQRLSIRASLAHIALYRSTCHIRPCFLASLIAGVKWGLALSFAANRNYFESSSDNGICNSIGIRMTHKKSSWRSDNSSLAAIPSSSGSEYCFGAWLRYLLTTASVNSDLNDRFASSSRSDCVSSLVFGYSM